MTRVSRKVIAAAAIVAVVGAGTAAVLSRGGDDAPAPQVSPSVADDAVLRSGFEDGLDGWGPRDNGTGAPTVAATDADAASGVQSALVSDRTSQGSGIGRDVTGDLAPGVTYNLSASLKFAAGETPGDLWLTLRRTTDGADSYDTLAQFSGMSADGWVDVTASFTPAAYEQAYIYFETAYSGTNTSSFMVDDIVITAPNAGTFESDLTPIKDTVDFPVGVAIDSRETAGSPSQLLLHHFNQVTPENHMKPEAWYDADHNFRPSPDVDAIMTFAQNNNIGVYGHVLVWHDQTPDWFFQDADGNPLTTSKKDKEILRQRMEDHIYGVANYLASEYGLFGSSTNPLVAFDVVNEVISDGSTDPGGLRASEWNRILGEDFIDLAFEYANDAFNDTYADPNADHPIALFINDYNTEQSGKRDRYKALISRLLDRGVPIDGIGHQFHVSMTMPVANLDAALADMHEFGLKQAVTEFDVTTGTPESEAKFINQGYYYRDAFRVFRDYSDQMFSVTMWGLTDGRSWRSADGGPLVFTDDLEPKQAYFGIVDGAEPGLLDPVEDPDSEVVTAESDVTEASAAPKIDGVREAAWDSATAFGTPQPVQGDAGAEAQAEVMWRGDKLYVLMHVVDDEIDLTGADPWTRDSVEIYVDAGNAKAGAYRPEDMQLRISADNVLSFGSGDEAAQKARVTSATKKVDDGYVVEVAIDMLGLGGAGTTHGFDLQVNDASNGERDSVRNWSDTSGTGYQATAVWGVIHLIAG